jgi:AraC family transcriptional regulator
MSDPCRDTAVCSSARGIAAVRRTSRVSNGMAVHAIEVDVSPEPAWADYSVSTHASLCVHLEHAGGRAELRLKRDQPAPDGSHSICFTPAGAPIWGYTQGAVRAAGVKLDFDLRRVSEAVGQKLITPDQPRSFRNDRLRRLAECLADECRTPDQFNRLYLDALTVAVCIDFLRLSAEPPGRRTGRLAASQVRSATDYVMEHLSEPVRLAALADLTGLSQWHFARAFKAATGLSPHQWQLNARIAKAQELLLSRSMPHAQIALEVGFAEQSHLCRVFKNMTGVSPAAWLRDRWTPRKSGL